MQRKLDPILRLAAPSLGPPQVPLISDVRRRLDEFLYPETMYPDPKSIAPILSGHPYIMAKPSGGENLEDDVRHLQQLGVGSVVSLLEASEVRELALEREGEVLSALGVSFRNLPVVDRSIPPDLSSYLESLTDTLDELSRGIHVVAHCRAGIGRSGMYCAALMIANGFSIETSLDAISVARGIRVPDTQIQIDWLHDHTSELAALRSS